MGRLGLGKEILKVHTSGREWGMKCAERGNIFSPVL